MNINVDVITASYGQSPLGVCASLQSIDEERGTVYYKQVKAADTRGNVTADQVTMDSKAAVEVAPRRYANSCIEDEVVGTTQYGTNSYSTTLSYLPIRPFTVDVKVTFSGTTFTATDSKGDGYLHGYDVQGTINYTTGEITVELDTIHEDDVTIYASYAQDMEDADDIPQIYFELTTESVEACVWALKETIGLAAAYALRRRFGIIAEDELAQDLVTALNAEQMNQLIYQLSTIHSSWDSSNSTTWSNTSPSGVSYFEHKQSLKDYIARAEGLILGMAGRGMITTMIAGRNACSILGTLPGFTKISDATMQGPHIYGTLDGVTIVRVPNSSILNANHILCLYKDNTSPFVAPAVVATYMPLVVTTALPTGQNPLLNQKAAAVWAGIKSLVGNFVSRIVISNY